MKQQQQDQQRILILIFFTLFFNRLYFFPINTNPLEYTDSGWIYIRGNEKKDQGPVYGYFDEFDKNNSPGSRKYFRLTKISNESYFLYGGRMSRSVNGKDYIGCYSDSWILNMNKWEWKWVGGSIFVNDYDIVFGSLNVYHDDTNPGCRYHHSLEYIKNDNEVVLFGGSNSLQSNNNVFIMNMDNYQWKWVSGNGDNVVYTIYGSKNVYGVSYIGNRLALFSSTLQNSNVIFFYGGWGMGESNNGYLGDVFLFNTNLNQWNWIAGSKVASSSFNAEYGIKNVYSSSVTPGNRDHVSGCQMSDDTMIIFGGESKVSGEFVLANDVFIFNLTTLMFKWIGGRKGVDFNIPQFMYGKHEYNESNMIGGMYGSVFQLTENEIMIMFFISNDIFYYNIDTDMFLWVEGGNDTVEIIPPRIFGYIGYNSFSDNDGDFISVFGGSGYADIWIYRYCVNYSINCDWKCYGIEKESPLACKGNGNCVKINTCKCLEGYSGNECDEWSCYNVSKSDNSVCSGHGTCGKFDNCQCDENYYGKECNSWNCSFISKDNSSVCSNKGSCISPQSCLCDVGNFGVKCNYWNCFGIENDQSHTCSFHGNCIDVNDCVCENAYTGEDCSEWSCNNITKNDKRGCNNRGICISPDECHCDDKLDKSQFCEGYNKWELINGEFYIYAPFPTYSDVYDSRNGPGARHLSSGCKINGTKLFVFGGRYFYNNDLFIFNDGWYMDTLKGQWKWVTGRKIFNHETSFGTLNVYSDEVLVGSRYGHQLTPISDNEVVLSGGDGFDDIGEYGLLNSVFYYKHVSDKYGSSMWKWVTGDKQTNILSTYGSMNVYDPGTKMGSRYKHSTVPIVSGSVVNEIWFYGGYGCDISSCSVGLALGDSFFFNVISFQWNYIHGNTTGGAFNPVYGNKDVYENGNSPGRRAFSVAVQINDNEILMFGGLKNGGSNALNDVFKFNIISHYFKWVGGSQSLEIEPIYHTKNEYNEYNLVGSRCGSKMFLYSEEEVLIFGGRNTINGWLPWLNDVFLFNFDTLEFNWIEGGINDSTIINIPRGRTEFSGAMIDDRIWIFGGSGYGDTWVRSRVVKNCFGIKYNLVNVCSFHGTCVDFHICECFEGFGGIDCNMTLPKCYNLYDPDACNGENGICLEDGNCSCSENWGGEQCTISKCYGKMDPIACNDDKGSCQVNGTCLCLPEWTDNECTTRICFGKIDPIACNDDKGTCLNDGTCSCISHYGGDECTHTKCYGKISPDVCNYGNGICLETGLCSCINNSDWSGKECNISLCDGKLESEGGCNFRGKCEANHKCTCFETNLFEGDYCEIPKCNGLSDPEACGSDNGICLINNSCSCGEDWGGFDCLTPKCYGKIDPEACNDEKGVCLSNGTCSCDINWDGSECTIRKCFGKINPEACNDAKGICQDNGTCFCISNWGGEECTLTKCYGKVLPKVCNFGNGTCGETGFCSCFAEWNGNECEIPLCNGKRENEGGCSYRGTCESDHKCNCFEPNLYGGDFCEKPKCNNLLESEDGCNNRGKCEDNHQCSCNNTDKWTGLFCETPICFGEINPIACNNDKGICNDANSCDCIEGFGGDNCKVRTCYGKEEPIACNEDHGSCIGYNLCDCMKFYYGNECTLVTGVPPSLSGQIEVNKRGDCEENEVTVTWQIFEDISGIHYYEWAIGIIDDTESVYRFTDVGLLTQIVVRDIDVKCDTEIYVTVKATSKAKLQSSFKSQPFIFINPNVRENFEFVFGIIGALGTLIGGGGFVGIVFCMFKIGKWWKKKKGSKEGSADYRKSLEAVELLESIQKALKKSKEKSSAPEFKKKKKKKAKKKQKISDDVPIKIDEKKEDTDDEYTSSTSESTEDNSD